MNTKLPTFAMIAFALVGASGLASANGSLNHNKLDPDIDTLHSYNRSLMAKASPDECFGGIGANYQAFNEGCQNERQPKVNQAYVWGLAKTDSDLWMGTAPNVNCLVEGTFLQMTSPYETPAWACEFGESGFRKAYAPYLPAALGDWRPSQIFRKTLSSSPISKTGKSTSFSGFTIWALPWMLAAKCFLPAPWACARPGRIKALFS